MKDRGATQGVARRGNDIVRGRVFGHERRGAGFESGEQLLVSGVHGQYHEADVGVCLAEFANEVQTRPIGKSHVGYDDVGHERGRPGLVASATDPASPATVKSGCRSKARERPCRIRSWSSTTSTLADSVMTPPSTLVDYWQFVAPSVIVTEVPGFPDVARSCSILTLAPIRSARSCMMRKP